MVNRFMKLVFWILLYFSTLCSYAQGVGFNVNNLTDCFGIISNVVVNGDSTQIASFDNSLSIGIDSGIVLSTGAVTSLYDSESIGIISNSVGDNDLLLVANSVASQIGQNFTVTSLSLIHI